MRVTWRDLHFAILDAPPCPALPHHALTPESISAFDAAERGIVAKLLYDRYGHAVELEDAEAELALDPPSPRLTPCPSLYWQARTAHFIVTKLGPSRYRCEFFYEDGSQFGTGIERFDDLRRCVLTLLRVQADHERDRGGLPQ